ncbi:MAG: EFR1 family ferrodoxin [Candidatus Thorarchaeota archaeon]
MKIGIFYFSATGITELISNHIAEILEGSGHSVIKSNLITPKSRKSTIDFIDFNMVFFGFPVFRGRAPSVAEDWMKSLDGKDQKCSMFFTYGARDLEWAHQATYYLLSQAHFRVVLSAEFIGKHSYNVGEGWSLAEERPNQLDFDIATEFALQSIRRFQEDNYFKMISDFSYQPIKIEERTDSWAKFYPSRNKNECSMCYLCEDECPVAAFDANSGETNRSVCITCMHCVTICPDKVIQICEVSQIFKQFVVRWGLTDEIVNQKKSKILYEI